MKISFPCYMMLVFAVAFSACRNESSPSKEGFMTFEDSVALLKSEAPLVSHGKYEMVISDIPFPFEILENLYSFKIPFNQKAMNEISNIPKYNQYYSKALNLGVYGADLAYSVTYEEFSQMGAYVKTTKRLAEELNIPYAFDQSMMDKYSKFKDNKDSLTRIVYESYDQVDKALKNDDRVGLAALVVAGSWLEGLYLSSKSFLEVPKTEDNKSFYKNISDQKQSLIIVVKLLEEYNKDEFISGIISALKDITSEYNSTTTDNAMNEKQLRNIYSKVDSLRKKIIEGQ